jgi:hypothetical protein
MKIGTQFSRFYTAEDRARDLPAASQWTMPKGESTYRQIDRDYPFQIEIRIAGDDWKKRHDAIVEFCAGLGHKKRPIGRERRAAINGDAVRLCFITVDGRPRSRLATFYTRSDTSVPDPLRRCRLKSDSRRQKKPLRQKNRRSRPEESFALRPCEMF